MKKIPLLVIILIISLSFQDASKGLLFGTSTGQVFFRSEAPLEIIEARSDKMKGLIDPGKMTFAFTIPIKSFDGFNSPLQREHFNENYMESNLYPSATFKGKIIEQIDLTKSGAYSIRAKGTLNIHGIEQERILKSDVVVDNGRISLKSNFTVPIKDHNITVPRVVNQKIAEEIKVEVSAYLLPQ